MNTLGAERCVFLLISLLLVGAHQPLCAQELNLDENPRLSDVDLRNLLELKPAIFLPELDGGRLYAGRKTLALDPAADAIIGNNNFRHLLARAPGVFLLEEEIQGVHFNVGFRGGAPNNGTFTKVFQDGFPLNVDSFGTRLVASAPDVNQITQVQLAYSGSSVLYGSQPGGAVNLIAYPAAGDQNYRVRSTTTAGAYGYGAELFEISGTCGDYSYAAFGRYARGDGFRVQPGFDNFNAGMRLERRFGDSASVSLGYQYYDFTSDQLSGVALSTGGVNNLLNYYYQDVVRHMVQMSYENDLSIGGRIESRWWYHYTDGFRDFSRTAAPLLGLTTERFHYLGMDNRFIQEYDLGPLSDNALTAGFTVQYAKSPLQSDPTRAGEARLVLNRHDFNWALFAENKFQITERWSVTPGIRYEYAEIAGNGFRATGDINRRFGEGVLLYSLGTEVDALAPRGLQERPLVVYANFAKGYRPPTYNETINQGFGTSLDPNLENATTYEVTFGLRGTPVAWYTYDLSGFWMDYDNQYAAVGGVVRNVGRTLHQGAEWFQEVNVFGLIDAWQGTAPTDRVRLGPRSKETESGLARHGRLNLFTSISWLDTRIKESSFAGAVNLDVPYAPEWTVKAGVSYNYFERIKAALFVRSVSDYLGNAANDDRLFGNNSAALVPGHSVVDLTLECAVWKDRATLFFNANNLLNERYFSGIQGGVAAANQIIAPGRSFYGGVRFAF
ncbi:MAG: TonB-dependent receptor [Verrucomicrobiota bacterium]